MIFQLLCVTLLSAAFIQAKVLPATNNEKKNELAATNNKSSNVSNYTNDASTKLPLFIKINKDITDIDENITEKQRPQLCKSLRQHLIFAIDAGYEDLVDDDTNSDYIRKLLQSIASMCKDMILVKHDHAE